MTREEVISWLRRYRRDETYKPSKRLFGWKLNYDFMRASYERFLVLELIRRINDSLKEPMDVIIDFYYRMDDIVCESEQSRTWTFASTMDQRSYADVLREKPYLAK